MLKKQSLLLLLPLIILLAACSGANTGASGSASGEGPNQPGQNGQGQAPDMSKQPIEQKLAVGTLMLEGTDQAVTAEEAKTLLPLWKAVKALSSSSNAADQELSAVYTQIQEAMTAEQVQKIKDMSLSREDTQALMEKYGTQMPRQNPGGGELSDSERATRIAQFQAERGNQGGSGNRSGGGQSGGAGGFPGDGAPGGSGGFPPGGMPGGGEGGFPGGLQNSTPGVQRTPQPGQGSRGMRGGGFNLMFVDSLIKLLTERAGA